MYPLKQNYNIEKVIAKFWSCWEADVRTHWFYDLETTFEVRERKPSCTFKDPCLIHYYYSKSVSCSEREVEVFFFLNWWIVSICDNDESLISFTGYIYFRGCLTLAVLLNVCKMSKLRFQWQLNIFGYLWDQFDLIEEEEEEACHPTLCCKLQSVIDEFIRSSTHEMSAATHEWLKYFMYYLDLFSSHFELRIIVTTVIGFREMIFEHKSCPKRQWFVSQHRFYSTRTPWFIQDFDIKKKTFTTTYYSRHLSMKLISFHNLLFHHVQDDSFVVHNNMWNLIFPL